MAMTGDGWEFSGDANNVEWKTVKMLSKCIFGRNSFLSAYPHFAGASVDCERVRKRHDRMGLPDFPVIRINLKRSQLFYAQ